MRLCRIPLFAGLIFAALPAVANEAPVAVAPSPSPTFLTGGAAQDLELKTLFNDPDVTGSAVRVAVRIGDAVKNIDIALFDQSKPITVTNFLAYVNAGRAANNFFHRSVPGFVVQGGGFRWTDTGVEAVPTFAPILNEYSLSNLRGTVAMAKLGGDANSATSQWFINLANNATILDGQNGGFTVFGRVVGSGMAVIDEVAALPIVNAQSPFGELPVKGFVSGTIERKHTVETNTTVVPVLSFSASSSDATLVAVSVTGSTLRLTPANNRAGTVTVTLSATDLDGATTQSTFNVAVQDTAAPSLNTPTAQTLTASISGTATVPDLRGSLVTATDAVGVTVFTQSPSPNNLLAPGTYPLIFSASDAAGNSSTVQTTLTVNPYVAPPDTTAPALSTPLPQTLVATISGMATVPDLRGTLVTASDAVGVTLFTQSPAPASLLAAGIYPLVFSASDAAGNSSSVQTTLTVNPYVAPPPQILPTAAYSGAPVPVPDGSTLPADCTFKTLATPAISDSGDLAARITFKAGTITLAGIYRETAGGQRELAAYQTESAPGVSNGKFRSFLDPLLSPAGALTFGAKLSGPAASEDQGVWTELFGDLALILREGAEVPGLSGLKLQSVTSLSVTDNALIALLKLKPATGLVNASNNTVLVRITGPAAGTLLARTGSGFEGSLIRTLSVLNPALGSNGQGRWHDASDVLAKFTLADKRSVLVRLGSDGSQHKLLQTLVPSGDPAVTLTKLGLPALGSPAIAITAVKAVTTGVSAVNDGTLLYAADGLGFQEAIQENALADVPDGARFAGFWDPVVNTAGKMLFLGTLRGTTIRSNNQSALWLSDGTAAPQLIARLGNAATDTNGATISGVFWNKFLSYALPNGPGAGPVFLAQLRGSTVNAQNRLGLWAVNSAGLNRLLLQTNTPVTLPSATKSLANLTLLNALPGSFGARRSYNSTGSLAVLATFTDKTQAILRIDLTGR